MLKVVQQVVCFLPPFRFVYTSVQAVRGATPLAQTKQRQVPCLFDADYRQSEAFTESYE